jgi:GNAT superfamily N-acetyltransferase
MSARIRAIQPHDYESAIALFAATYPDRAREVDSWAAAERLEAARRWVALADASEQVIGYGSIWHVRLDKFRLDLMIHPDWRRRGIGAQLLLHLVECARRVGAATLQARAEDNADDALAFLHRRGFVETMRMHRLALRVAEADLTPFADLEAQFAARRIVITTLHDEQAGDSACWEKLCELYNATRSGWPDPDPGPTEMLTVDELRGLFTRFDIVPGAFFIAKRSDAYLGFTGATGTGVRPMDRNQGIATALKVRAIAYARDHGCATLRSASGNPAMLRVNEKLGFRRTSTEVRLVKKLQAREGPQPAAQY